MAAPAKQWWEIEYYDPSTNAITRFGTLLLTQAQADQLMVPGNGQVINGPYRTKAAALSQATADNATLTGGHPSGGNPSGGGQWWIIWTTDSKGNLAGKIVQASSRPSMPPNGDSIEGPYSTQAAAQAEAARYAGQKASGYNPASLGPTGAGIQAGASQLGWDLSVNGISGWFWRALKVVGGAVLIILGLSRITGASNAITKAATQAAMAAKEIPVE